MGISNYPAQSGLVVGADGHVYDAAAILRGGTGTTLLTDDIKRYPARGGLIVGQDNIVYDLPTLLMGSRGSPMFSADDEGRVCINYEESENE